MASMRKSSGDTTLPQRPTRHTQKERELTADMTVPRRLERDMAPKYEKRVFTPRLSIIHDDQAEENEDREDDEELEYPDNEPPIPGVPLEFLPHSSPDRLYTFLESASDLSAEIGTSAGELPKTTDRLEKDTKTIDDDGKAMTASTASRLASSLRRHLSMRTMREQWNKTTAFSRTWRLPGRNVKETTAQEPGARGGADGKNWEGSLARRLFSRDKKPKRPKVPDGWLFGPPPE